MKSTLQSVNSTLIQGSHSSSGENVWGSENECSSDYYDVPGSVNRLVFKYYNKTSKKKKKENFSNMTEGESVNEQVYHLGCFIIFIYVYLKTE